MAAAYLQQVVAHTRLVVLYDLDEPGLEGDLLLHRQLRLKLRLACRRLQPGDELAVEGGDLPRGEADRRHARAGLVVLLTARRPRGGRWGDGTAQGRARGGMGAPAGALHRARASCQLAS